MRPCLYAAHKRSHASSAGAETYIILAAFDIVLDSAGTTDPGPEIAE